MGVCIFKFVIGKTNDRVETLNLSEQSLLDRTGDHHSGYYRVEPGR